MSVLHEAALEEFSKVWLAELGWQTKNGKDIAPGSGERTSYADLVILSRLRNAVERINPALPATAVDEAVKLVLNPKSQEAYGENHQAHEYMTRGIRSVTYTDEFGATQNPTIRLVDSKNPESNDFLAVNQVPIAIGEYRGRFDLVLYVNGLPVSIIELKNAGDPNATVQGAHAQLMNYVADFPMAFRFTAACLVSDGINAKYGTAFTPFEHFAPWNLDDDGKPVNTTRASSTADLAVYVALHGLYSPARYLQLMHGFVNFIGSSKSKRIAKPHQYFAVTKALRKIVEASRSNGKAGVVWHTQGSGKSEEMVCLSALAARHPALGNPTIVVITDRNDLDDQLYSTFLESQELTGQQPLQILTREKLREELTNKRTGGILFTTLQKFGRTEAERKSGADHPLLSDRSNIIVIVDEAHRSHYDDLDGYARHLRDALPKATMIAFTGTPISETSRNTRNTFGDYIDIYDLTRAVDDEATVRVFHESRLIPVDFPQGVDPETIDEAADKLTVGMDDAERRKAEQSATVLTNIYGAPKRIKTLAENLLTHWAERSEKMRPYIGGAGKAMVVCASREICVRLYDAIRAVDDTWHGDTVDTGRMKIVFTSDSSERTDKPHLHAHRLREGERKTVLARAKSIEDELEILIVNSMLLTGFDAPPMHTMYMDRPMHGANLMQALARVNRRYRQKQDGLLVGYAPLTESLHKALAEYTARDQEEKPLGQDLEHAVDEVRNELRTISENILAGYDWRGRLARRDATAHIDAVLGTVEYLRNPQTPGNDVQFGDPDLGERFRRASSRLERFWAICSTSGQLNEFRDDIAFYGEVRRYMVKFDAADRDARGEPLPADVRLYLAQLADAMIEADGVTDLYAAAGLELPDLSRLNEAYIKQLQDAKNPHLNIEQLRRLIEQNIREANKHNVVRRDTFSAKLRDLMIRYMNQQLTSAQVIAELVEMAKEISNDASRGQNFTPPLDNDQLAFYDAVAANPEVVNVMGEGVLAGIARDLVAKVRQNLTIDWMSREPVRAKLRATIKRLLALHGYPPDQITEDAVGLVLTQMETFAEDWAPRT